jgi:hypothetical protein
MFKMPKDEARSFKAGRRDRLTAFILLVKFASKKNEIAENNIQEIEQNPYMDAMVPGHFFPHHPPNLPLGPLESIDDVFTPRFFVVAGLLVVLFWRVPSV